MANLPHLNKVKFILNAFEDSKITAHEFLHRLLSTNIFEDHPITLSILEDLNAILNTIPNQNGVGDQNVMLSHGADLGPNVRVNH